jgi:hypothetical protein
MRSRLLVTMLVILQIFFVTGLFAEDGPNLTPLYNELEVLFEEIGDDTSPHLQSYGLIMEGTGAAEIGPHFFFSLSAGTAFMPGILTFRTGENPFAIFNVGQLLADAVGTEGIAYDIYSLSEAFFLNPGARLSIGMGFENGLEFFGYFGIIPQIMLDLVIPLLPIEGLEGLTFNRFNAGVRARKVLLSDQAGFPAVSLNVGYTLTQFNAGVDNLSLLPIEGLELSGFDLVLDGAMAFKTSMHTAGVELDISKEFGFFVPFVRLGAWQQWTSYSAGITDLTISMTSETQTDPIIVSGTDPMAERWISDLSFIPAGGFELQFGKFSFIIFGSYNTASGSAAADMSLQFRF